MNLKDRHILGKIRKGDIKTFETLFHQYYPGMCLYANSILRKEEVSEELVQDVFYNIWKNRLNFRLSTGWKSYLYGAVHKNCLNYLRKNKRLQRLDQKRLETEKSMENDPLEQMNYRELNNRILRTLGKLPERTGEIFRLSRFDGLTYPEIAEKLGISVKTVEANMGKALSAFRDSLKDYVFVKK